MGGVREGLIRLARVFLLPLLISPFLFEGNNKRK